MREQAGGCSFLLEEHPERPTHFLCLGSEKIKVALGKSEKYERGKKNPFCGFYFHQASFCYSCLILKLMWLSPPFKLARK